MALLNFIVDPAVIVDEKGHILLLNNALENLTGFSKKELIGKSFFEVNNLTAESKPILLENLMKRMQGLSVEPYEINFTDKTGKARCAEVKAKKIDYSGQPADLIIFRDITRRKENARRLKEYSEKMEALVNEKVKEIKESEAKYSELINGMNDTAWVIGLDGNFIDVNDTAVKVLGYSREELLRMGPPDIDNSLTKEQIKDLIRSMPADQIQVFETAYITKDGKTIPVEINSSLVTYQGKQAILSIARDITKRKQAEEELRETKDYLDNLLNYANAPIIVWDNENKISLFNNAFEALTGYKKESVLGRNIDVLFPPLQKEEIMQTIKKATKGEKWQSVEVPILCKGKETRIALWNSANITDKDGNIVATIAQGQDITERKQAEEALKESEEKFRNLFENARDIIFTTDLKGNITEINRFVEKYGFKRDEVVGKNMLKFVPKKYWPKLLRGVAKLSQGNLVEGEIEIITPKGKIISEYRSNPIRREKKVVGFQTILRNITERKAMEERLRQYSGHLEELVQKRTKELLESEKRYSVLVEEANVGVATLQDGKIVFANKKGEEIVGYSKEELFGLPFMKLVSEEYRQIVMERYAQRIKGESVPATYEIEVNAKNGEHIPVEISAAHISYQGHPADLIIVRDIREKKRMEEQRSKLERLASIGELAAMVGHDLRNPLTGIMGAAYYLKTKHGTEVGAKGKEMLETIEKAINYSNKIINDLLEYSRDLKLKLTETTPKTMLQRALSLLEVPEKIQIVDNTKDKPMVKADTEKIRKVFVNIIQNAIDAMPEGGTLTIKSRKVKDTLEIAFKDTGAGMSEETLSKLKGGVPLFTTKSKGMGFGLPICKRLAEAHGGKLSVESPAGKGTTVTVTIPVNPEPVDEGEEKWIFSESMLSAITSTQRAP